MAVAVRSIHRFVARLGAYLPIALGASVLIGWTSNVPVLLTVLPGRITMKPNTAIAFICAGAALALLTKPSVSPASRNLAALLSTVVIAIGLFTLFEYLLHRDFGIDEIFCRDLVQHPYPGRMAHIAAISFCLVGTSLLLLSMSEKQAHIPQVLAFLSGSGSLLAMVGYLYGVPLLYGSIQYTSMALHTGAGFMVLSIAILCCRPEDGIMAVVSSQFGGGWFARRLLPVAVITPVLLGAVYIYSKFSLNDVRFALACLIVSQVSIFVTLIWLLASALNRAEYQQISAQEALRESEGRLEQKYRGIVEEAIFGIFQSTPDGRYLSANPAVARMFGYDRPEELIASVQDLARQVYVDPRRRLEFQALIERHGEVRNFEAELYRKDGSTVWVSANARAIFQDGVVVRYEGMNQDITERKLLEGQLLQAQKMEAVGRLAGGVAHDFNNAIGVVVGYSTLLKERIGSDELSLRYTEEIGKAGQRAASLTRQLLAFSRKQIIQPTILNLNSIIAEMDKMLHRLIGEDIEVVVNRDPNLGRIKADLGQIEQILMNLAVNARDAMPQGGKLIIETANAELDEGNLAQHPHAKPGRYVVLSVSDTGCGMDKETQAHIFEPFFTTKGHQGTGLGLSTVYGIVKQSDGYIWVYSQKNNGTRFKICFPRVEAAVQPTAFPEDMSVAPGGTETVLLVEDDESMRKLTRRCLADHGYTALDVQNGEAAIRTASQYDGRIHLLLTDVVMPGISGRHLAESLAVSRPEMRCLYMSGYTADLIAKHGVLEPQVALLEKPFTQDALLRQLRKILDSPNFAMVAVAGAGSSF